MDFSHLSRRTFLQGTGTTAAGVAITGTLGAGGIAVAEDASWAFEAKALDETTIHGLIAMARQLYPHEFLDDGPYVKVVAGLDASAAEDADLQTLLTDGVRGLGAVVSGDSSADVAFHQQSRGLQLRAIKRAEGDNNAFFEAVRGAALGGLYGNPEVAAALGFEGSAVEHGGYLDRGFDDIDWLPQSS